MTIGLVATLTVKAGSEVEFERLFGLQAAAVRSHEPGNTLYSLLRSRADPNVYIVMELYDDEAALDAHRKGAHLQEFRPQIGPLLAAPTKIETYDAT